MSIHPWKRFGRPTGGSPFADEGDLTIIRNDIILTHGEIVSVHAPVLFIGSMSNKLARCMSFYFPLHAHNRYVIVAA